MADGKKTYDLKVSAGSGSESIAIFENGTLKYQRQRSGKTIAGATTPPPSEAG
jgi:hypothetical protein